jgi:hypothetical protein
MGQRGSFWRRYALEELQLSELVRQSTILVRDEFGGTLGANGASIETGQEYVAGLLNTNISMCPPGNYSSSTFRYLESLICGAIPAIAEGTPTDALFRAPFGPHETCKWARWEDLIRVCGYLEEGDRKLLVRHSLLSALKYFDDFTQMLLLDSEG